MKAQKDSVVAIHYTLKDDEGEVIDSSTGQEPLEYLHGHNNIVAGLEEVLEGAEVGAAVEVKVPPEKGYGNFDPEWVQKVPKSSFQGVDDLQIGMVFVADTEAGPRQLFITAIEGDEVEVNGNHPLAGQNLNFAVTVEAIRAAAEEELAQGHANSPDGEG